MATHTGTRAPSLVHPYDARDDARLKSFIALSGSCDCYSNKRECHVVLDLLLKNCFCEPNDRSACSSERGFGCSKLKG